ncbi:hypothetical protein ACMFRU_002538 [Vibrio cholerae]|uniref:hypothetical protein n=1 Tax=Vibrio cholerae TaxID=666 RepID=UPI00115BA437|nr:hypothetical protein [Vibrio cholerae]ELE2134426.1 hypothetical protein [Vibrio cholerae]MCD1170015.1 hypothetical protein [Vibrio cholerae]TQP24085.1 hypothetical protein FLM00_10970 [Vibrio cholerae]HDZ9243937.1 hypothetical protein [Vibrio cholerae]HDZ9465561.1 hypothetical protein [Vibrio cholerae]
MAIRMNFLGREDEEKTQSPPSMARSRGQLGSAYAPGSFFTFEGGLGACISLPDLSATVDDAPIHLATKAQIILRLQEIWQSWFTRAYAVGTEERLINPHQCLDEALLRGCTVEPMGLDRLAFLSPLRMGYAPAPLTFVCNKCSSFRRFESVHDVAKNIDKLRKTKCASTDSNAPCQWRQLDVIFVHWSGEWMPVTPGRWEWDERKSQLRLYGEECSVCGKNDFKLNTNSPRIGQWHFYCANPTCGHKGSDEWRQNDPFSTRVFGENASRRMSERRMEPISYRASSAFYAQSEQFVLFPESEHHLMEMLEPQRQSELASFISKQFRFGGDELTPEDMKASLLAAGQDNEWESYENVLRMRELAHGMGDADGCSRMDKELKKLVDRWTTSNPPLVQPRGDIPPAINVQLAIRNEYTSRFDPFVLAVEHEALNRGKLSAVSDGGRSKFVRFNHLDNDLAPKDACKKAAQEAKTQHLMTQLGIVELGLIREFDLCRFTHGYTRVSATPTLEKRKQFMPVRLRLFEPLRNGKRPIYVVTQANEAIYVRLNPSQVYKWLRAVGVVDLPEWDESASVRLGGKILEVAQPFGRYFSLLKEGDASTYRYVYTLLHTYAHVVMKNVAELSGLDLGSMGEYIFPLDFAFVVYRNGTTMDLGNLSSLWRNENNQFLERLLMSSTHRCNSGRLCDTAGGACPDCIMIPDTSCIAQNQLLSRAVLKGGPSPREDSTHKGKKIPGFLEVVNTDVTQ